MMANVTGHEFADVRRTLRAQDSLRQRETTEAKLRRWGIVPFPVYSEVTGNVLNDPQDYESNMVLAYRDPTGDIGVDNILIVRYDEQQLMLGRGIEDLKKDGARLVKEAEAKQRTGQLMLLIANNLAQGHSLAGGYRVPGAIAASKEDEIIASDEIVVAQPSPPDEIPA